MGVLRVASTEGTVIGLASRIGVQARCNGEAIGGSRCARARSTGSGQVGRGGTNTGPRQPGPVSGPHVARPWPGPVRLVIPFVGSYPNPKP